MKSLLPFVVTALVAAAVGFWIARASSFGKESRDPKGASPLAPEAVRPEDALAQFASAVVRWQGPFKDPFEQIEATQKVTAFKNEVLRFGRKGFDAAVAFLGNPVELAAAANAAAQTLGEPSPGGARRSIPALDPVVRESVIDLLLPLDAERAPAELARRMLDDNESERVRARAAGELGHATRRDVAIPALVEALDRASERAWHGSRAIVESMATLGGPEVSEALLQAFVRPSTSQELRIAVTQSLGLLRASIAIPALENVVRHEDRDHYVRREAVRAILRIDPARAETLTLEQIEREPDVNFKKFLEDVARSRGK